MPQPKPLIVWSIVMFTGALVYCAPFETTPRMLWLVRTMGLWIALFSVAQLVGQK